VLPHIGPAILAVLQAGRFGGGDSPDNVGPSTVIKNGHEGNSSPAVHVNSRCSDPIRVMVNVSFYWLP
jgi:hypothetical protein